MYDISDVIFKFSTKEPWTWVIFPAVIQAIFPAILKALQSIGSMDVIVCIDEFNNLDNPIAMMLGFFAIVSFTAAGT